MATKTTPKFVPCVAKHYGNRAIVIFNKFEQLAADVAAAGMENPAFDKVYSTVSTALSGLEQLILDSAVAPERGRNAAAYAEQAEREARKAKRSKAAKRAARSKKSEGETKAA